MTSPARRGAGRRPVKGRIRLMFLYDECVAKDHPPPPPPLPPRRGGGERAGRARELLHSEPSARGATSFTGRTFKTTCRRKSNRVSRASCWRTRHVYVSIRGVFDPDII